jgi:hypothetical protein
MQQTLSALLETRHIHKQHTCSVPQLGQGLLVLQAASWDMMPQTEGTEAHHDLAMK